MNFRSCTLLLLACGLYISTIAQQPAKPDSTKPKKDSMADAIKHRMKSAGLFTLYQDTSTGSVLMYVKKNQVGKDKEFIYQSFSMGGPANLFLNQNMIRETWVFNIQRRYNKLEFNRVNVNYYYDPANAVSKAAGVDVSDAIFYSERIIAEDADGYLISTDALLLSDKLDAVKPVLPPTVPPGAVFNLGAFNPGKSGYEKIRSYPNNTDVVVSLAYDNPAPFNWGGDDITDARYVRVKMQHSFIEMPKNDYRPRHADPRVGYFTQERNDMTAKTSFSYNDLINRWHLVKKDPSAAMSEPVEPIVWWIENTTPVELRPIIMEAGLKWNEAFEKAGFKNAVVMKIMPDDATWDPADIRYNVIRWVSSDLGYAIGPSFVNPRTGQILGADITIDYAGFYSGTLAEQAIGDVNAMYDFEEEMTHENNGAKHNYMNCSIAKGMRSQYAMGRLVADLDDNDIDPTKDNLFRQFFIELVLHEMGHTMGLNHNMKASQMLSPAEMHDKNLTRSLGTMGSVMDYSAVNISLDRSKQGDYYSTKTGPYDWWAIEFGYTQFNNDTEEKEGLNRILSRSTDPRLTFGNDADIVSFGRGIDPRVQVWDMSGDMVAYAADRFKLVNYLMPKLRSKFTKTGKTYSDLVSKYRILNSQRNAMAVALSRYIGGVYVDRSVVGQSNNQPYTPVPSDYQKKALKTISTYIFSPGAFNVDAALLPYLQLERRGYRFGATTEDPKPDQAALSIQRNVINYLLFPGTLRRCNNTTLYGNNYSAANVMTDLTAAIFDEDLKTNVNLYRQNLQTEYLKQVAAIVTSPAATATYDNPSRAAALSTLKSIRTKLATAVSTNEPTKAHRSSLLFMIEKALAVK